ncbi:GAF domain-containing protein [Curtobacterium sp. 458]|uniref:PP2C family protein-serine/threonine phosphatase n=1 Tax=Curtobacterium sp. 458 TaxID=3050069 RepID=UPI0025B3CF19|nr:GAF domain-containing protein [Curtobacterium sp. 458]WJY01138.1 SpoIIE family protein phosphatase [Curtobacterium sp. 458]
MTQSSTALPLDPAARRTAVVEALGVLGSGPEERFDRITRMTQEAFGVPLTFLNLVHHDVVTTQSTFGWQQGSSVPASEQFCATTVLTPEPMVIPDTTLDVRFATTAAVAEHGIRFYAGAPLSMLDGTRVGTLCIMDAQPREFGAEDVALLRDLARWAERELGHAIDRRRVRRVLEGLAPAPVEVPGHTVTTASAQPDGGGGDVVDQRVAADGALHLTVGTVAAGRASALLASAVRGAVAARTDVPLERAVAGLEAQLAPDLSLAGAVATLVHARVDPRTGHVDVVDLGHGLAAVVRADGPVEELRSASLPVGLRPQGSDRTPVPVDLGSGDVLVLASDGALALPGVDGPTDLARTAAGGDEAVRALIDAAAPTLAATVTTVCRD